MAGSVYKLCGCTEAVKLPDGSVKRRELGAACPLLRRPGGGWSSTHGKWAFHINKTVGGKRSQLKRRGYMTKRDAQEAMSEALRQLAQGVLAPPARFSTGEYLLDWLSEACRSAANDDPLLPVSPGAVPASNDRCHGPTGPNTAQRRGGPSRDRAWARRTCPWSHNGEESPRDALLGAGVCCSQAVALRQPREVRGPTGPFANESSTVGGRRTGAVPRRHTGICQGG